MTRHVVIDLETLGVQPCATILSIGAVAFDHPGRFAGEFEALVQRDQPGRSVDADTVAWWEKQARPARELAFGGREDLGDALRRFADWYRASHNDKTRVWGNGATFDVSMIEHAMRQHAVAIPWKFWNVRDVRTLREFLPHLDMPANDHGALSDARNESAWVRAALAIMDDRLCLRT